MSLFEVKSHMMLVIIIITTLLFCCQSKPQNSDAQQTTGNAQEIDSTDFYAKPVTTYDYRPFYGIYDHESTTAGFSAVVTINPSGTDLLFTVSVAQGECKGESEGVITMFEHTENYYAGFYSSENCRMQFSFILQPELKIDIKEVTLCSHHGSNCSYDGIYAKRAG
jgi:hypothetical protein